MTNREIYNINFLEATISNNIACVYYKPYDNMDLMFLVRVFSNTQDPYNDISEWLDEEYLENDVYMFFDTK